VAAGILTLVLLALVASLLPAAWYLRNRGKQIADLLDGVQRDLAPLARHTSGLIENLERISGTIRADVEKLSGSVHRIDDQLNRAADVLEQRVHEFDALLGTVQEEAEALFVTSASVVRGARAGYRAFRGRRGNGDAQDAEGDESPDARAEAPDEGTRGTGPRLRRRHRSDS
jgi:ABC-type transporter Mla subunit MlaD